MKQLLAILLAIGLTAAAAWLVRGPSSAQADEIPEKYRETANKGLEYLAARQHKDGHWEGDNGQHPVAMTGLVGIALLMECEPPIQHRLKHLREAKYAPQIRKAADWLVKKSQASRDGLIFSNHASETTRYMQGHGLATIFLAGACGIETDETRSKALREVVAGAVAYIVKSQSSQGGWHDTSKLEGHDFASIETTVLQVQALQAAENVGFAVPAGALSDGQEYLRGAIKRFEADSKVREKDVRAVELAGALAAFGGGPEYRELGRTPANDFLAKAIKRCEAEIPAVADMKLGRDDLAHCWFAQALHDRGNASHWSKHREALFDRLRSGQNDDGSWPAGRGLAFGPVYSTALWCIALQLDKKSHPSYRQIELMDITELDSSHELRRGFPQRPADGPRA